MDQRQSQAVPESWDDVDQSGAAGDHFKTMENQFSGFNINAVEFVPSFGPRVTDSVAAPSTSSVQPSLQAASKKVSQAETDSVVNSKPEQQKATTELSVAKQKREQNKPTAAAPVPARVEEPTDDMDIDQDMPPPVTNIASGPRKEHVNIVFIGHVDAGKSTIGGHMLLLTGAVDKRTMEKYEKEAKEAGRESWWLSWALDTNPEERDKGKTVEVGRACFETDNKLYTILDAPGHKSYVMNMVEGASQADIGILVISARKGEFETGFERGGQTREHAVLAKTSGVRHLIVLINKMDDPTVNWSEERYNEIKAKLLPFLKSVGFKETDLCMMPISGYTGANMKDRVTEAVCPWYNGKSFLEYMDSFPKIVRSGEGPVRVPIIGRFKEMGTVVTGKVESGQFKRGDHLLIMPNRIPVEVIQIWSDETEVDAAMDGDNVRVKLKGVEEEDVQPGFILCDSPNPCKTGQVFDAEVAIMDHKNIVTSGYGAIMHLHALQEPVTVELLICLIDKKTKEKTSAKFMKPGQKGILRLKCADGMVCMETFADFPQLGRFTLRDEGRTVGFGTIKKIVR